MLKNKNLWRSAVCLLLAVCMFASLTACGCSNNPPATKPSTGPSAPTDKTAYTVTVTNGGGLALEGIGVYIYADETLEDLLTFAKTDAEGKIVFTESASDKYVAVLQNLPTGYAAEPYYALTGEQTKIVLSAAQMPTDGQQVVYKLGDMFMDFEITDTEGTKYTLSQLLQQKKAVVLNFWYTKCEPCKMEFPYLQQAYAQYSDQIAVLALNPVDQDDAALAAFKKDNGLTFPVAKVDAAWQDMMQIVAYPTTVVIDRFGNITLIHKGSITDAKTFTDMFAYFSAEDYQQKFLQDIAEIEPPVTEGTEENPLEIGGVTKYELTLKPGQVFYLNAYRVDKMYMQIQNKDAYVIYDGKTYNPSSGVVGLMVYCEDTNTPAKLIIGNKSDKEQTFTITFSPLPGSFNNPYDLELGTFTAKVSAGNEQGVYYAYTAAEDGILTMQCLSATANVGYDYALYNLDSYTYRTMSSESEADPDSGEVTLSMPAKKGQTIQFSIGTLPDSDNNYPAGTFQMKAAFTTGGLEEEDKVEKIPYTVTVTDENGNPIANVNVYLSGNEQSVSIKTDENGVAATELPKGEYTGRVTIPTDYTLEVNEFKLTETESAVTVQLVKKVVTTLDYVVKVVDAEGNPVSGVMLIVGDGFATTENEGTAVFNLLKDAYQVEIVDVPEGYILPTQKYAFEGDATELTVTLEAILPVEVYLDTSMSFTTESIAAGKKLYYDVYRVGGMILSINDKDAFVNYNGKTYGANANGVVEVPLEQAAFFYPTSLQIGNAGTGAAKTFTVQFRYPLGHAMNPQILSELGAFDVSLAEGNDQGYNLKWTADQKGTVNFMVISATENVAYDVALSNPNSFSYPLLSESDSGIVSMDVEPGDEVTIVVGTDMDENFQFPACDLTLVAYFDAYVAPPEPTVPPTEPTVPPTEPTVPPTEPTVPPTEPTEPDVIVPVDVFLDESMSFTTDNVSGGEEMHYNVYGVGGMILSINDKDAYVIYNGQLYAANAGGIVQVTMNPGAPFYPNLLQIGNSGTGADEAYKVYFSYPKGSMMNPELLSSLGSFSVSLAEGNDQGYYFKWIATQKGTVNFKVTDATAGVGYDVALSNPNSFTYPLLSESDNGIVSMDVEAGDEVTVVVGTDMDENFQFPACDLTLYGYFEAYVAPSEPTVPPTEPTVPPTEPTVPPTEPVEPPSTKMDYKVTIVDKDGELYQSAVLVRVYDSNENTVYQGSVSTGMVTMNLEKGTYTVKLNLSDSNLSYDANAAILTIDMPELTITVAPKLSGPVEENILDVNHFVLEEGTTNVKLGVGEANYSQQDDVGYNFFAFKITEPGVYTFTTSSKDAVITNWGSSDFFMANMTTDEEYAANKLEMKFLENNFSGDGSPITVKFAVKINEAVTSTNIIIKYEGEVVLTPEQQAEWVAYVPEVKQEKFKLAEGEGAKLVYMDVTSATSKYKLVFNEDDGYYHLDKKDGPVIYVNLGGSAPYLSLQSMVATAAVRAIIYDDNNVFVAKEDYTECLSGLTTSNPNKPNNDGYLECIDPTYGVYPLTKDLKHILESACKYLGWAKEYGVLYDQIANINPEIAWMYACCYVPETN